MDMSFNSQGSSPAQIATHRHTQHAWHRLHAGLCHSCASSNRALLVPASTYFHGQNVHWLWALLSALRAAACNLPATGWPLPDLYPLEQGSAGAGQQEEAIDVFFDGQDVHQLRARICNHLALFVRLLGQSCRS